MAKVIVLLADGTGNSAAKLFKTNVWRLYRALDLSDSPQQGLRQVAYYHDGVGTSSFKPLTILGGVFGIGLKRNVLDLYSLLCRNYERGDRIYVFGFSRGAFTVRVLASLIATQGILTCPTEQELSRYVPDMYRRYRRRYKLPLLRRKDKTERTREEDKVGLVDRLRDLRDVVIRVSRRILGSKQFDEVWRTQREDPEKDDGIRIDFIGVWDTVAAYGLPIDELTRGVDEWIWPLSMPNYFLSDKVLRARHALSLDDERNTFHPLLWDEKYNSDRLQQVWFAGMHSDVGGGYPDDSLSGAALEWMMAESEKPIRDTTGLRFLPQAQRDTQLSRSDFGPLHNSRSGLGSYYRYQPRRIAAYTRPPDHRTTMMIQDPNRGGEGFLNDVLVHESVLHRIRAGNDRYAPIVLPNRFKELKSNGTTVSHTLPVVSTAGPGESQDVGLAEWVWNDVWRRRVNYFMTVGVSLVLALLPFIHAARPPSACTGPQCALTPVITTIGAVLPGFVQPWIDAFAHAPGLTLILAICILLLLARSANLKRRINDGMRELWEREAGQRTAGGIVPQTAPTGGIYALRTHPLYQTFFQWLKWRIFPGAFGATMLFGGALAIAALVFLIVQRADIAIAERTNRYCTPTEIGKLKVADGSRVSSPFETKSKCWASGIKVEKGKRYVLTLRVTKDWVDRTIRTSPLGFENSRHVWYIRSAVLLRRSLSGNWFQPMIKIVPASGRRGHTQFAEMRCECGQGPVYSAEFVAERDGELMLFVNDMMPLLLPRVWPALSLGEADDVYENNEGEAEVTIKPAPLPPPRRPTAT